MAEDSTDRTCAEEALREVCERYALATAAGGVGVWDREIATGALYLDPALYTIFGFDAAEIDAAALWPGRVYPDDRDRAQAMRRAALAPDALRDPDGHTPLPEIECRVRHRDGSTRRLLVRGRVLRQADGTPYRLLGTATDITARTRAEAAAWRGVRRYRALFEQASDPIFIITADGATLDANARACALLGYRREELLALTVPELVVTNPALFAATRTSFLAGEMVRTRRQARRKDGALVPIEIVAGMLEDRRIEVIARDISARERAEALREELGARLIQAVDEERGRVARELHDGTAQDLFAQSLLLQRLAQPTARLDRRGREILAEARLLGEQALRDLRTQSYLLHPPLLKELGLLAALEWLVGGFAQRSGIAVELAVDEAVGRLPGAVELALFRVAQEGLTNVHHHAGSAVARVALAREGDTITLRVEDRGRGLPDAGEIGEGAPWQGVGLTEMRQRLRHVGGRLALTSSGEGTVVTAVVPLPSEAGN